jgi:hypothetical protein
MASVPMAIEVSVPPTALRTPVGASASVPEVRQEPMPTATHTDTPVPTPAEVLTPTDTPAPTNTSLGDEAMEAGAHRFVEGTV